MDVSRDPLAAAVPSSLTHLHNACEQQGFAAGSPERDLLNAVGSVLHQHQHDLLIVHQQQQDAVGSFLQQHQHDLLIVHQQQQDVIHQHQEFMHDKFKHLHDELNILKRSVLQIKAQFDVHKVTYPISMYACTLFHILLTPMLLTGVLHVLVFLREVFCN